MFPDFRIANLPQIHRRIPTFCTLIIIISEKPDETAVKYCAGSRDPSVYIFP